VQQKKRKYLFIYFFVILYKYYTLIEDDVKYLFIFFIHFFINKLRSMRAPGEEMLDENKHHPCNGSNDGPVSSHQMLLLEPFGWAGEVHWARPIT
jgi:hypothetical protein